jgi:hypothetical protein
MTHDMGRKSYVNIIERMESLVFISFKFYQDQIDYEFQS